MTRCGAILIVIAVTLTTFLPSARAGEQVYPPAIAGGKDQTPSKDAGLQAVAVPMQPAATAADVNGDGSAPDVEAWRRARQDEASGVLPGELLGEISVVSLFQSFSNTMDAPVGEGNFTYSVDVGLAGARPYLRVRGANGRVKDGGAATTEFDLEGGLTGTLAALGWTIGGRHLTCLVAGESSASYQYWEIPLELSIPLSEHFSLLGQYAYSPNFIANSGRAHYALVGARWEQSVHSATFSVEGTTGHQWIADNATYGAADYQDWRTVASLTVAFN
ncbi:hypothetical protein [Defluviicoccus vanus]|uniref:Uncharacterized protein n=1 Tax=Defluviicoccus vanus TaxID=111831 RepID=A0A7H1N378_9PROT|nr:hypothetical protein [Defluviicoccus vanus]QNT70164.1 hypothetical protein HQ394_13560 [Defluviicoccus vanus]